MKKFSLLVVGTGSIGRRHIDNFSNFFSTIDICDNQNSRILEAKDKFQFINNTYTDFEIALNNNNYDVVCITTPPHLHKKIAYLAVQRNMNIFIEKPLGISSEGWEEIKIECDKRNLISYVAYCIRHVNYTQHLKKIIDDKLIGKVINANLRWGSYLPDWHPYEDYRTFYMAKKEEGGGALLDESHGIDLIRYLFGEVESVFGVVNNFSDLEITSDDCAFLTFKMKNKILCHLNFDLVARYPRINLEIIGEKGSVIWDRVENSIKIFTIDKNKWETLQFTKDDLLAMYPNQAKYFYECLSEKKQAFPDIADSIKTQKVIDCCFESEKEKKEITI